jgi:hypothetical protein
MKKVNKVKPIEDKLLLRQTETCSYIKQKPVFSFEYLVTKNLCDSKDCHNNNLYRDLFIRLQKIDELGWSEVRKSDRHQYGTEKIDVSNFKIDLPNSITPDVTSMIVVRADGKKHVFAGFMRYDIFFIVFIECNFGNLYDHD